MKILYGITKSNFGGAQRYVFDLAKAAKAAGHDVAVLCGGSGVLVEKLEADHIRVIRLPHLKRDISLLDELRSLLFIVNTLHDEQPDIFHTNSSKMGGLGNVAARLNGVKRIIFTGHGWAWNESWRPYWQKALIKFFTWLTILSAHRTICVSHKNKQDVEGWPLVGKKISVIWNGLAPFELEPRKMGGFVVGTIAELHKVKGLDVLLRAWQRFHSKREAKLVIYGEGEERQSLERLAGELGIASSVEFKGYAAEARTLLKNFDIFALPSRSENLPYALLEAGFAGLPVVATSVGGVPEVIEPGVSGALVEPGDPEALFSSLLLLADDAMLRARLGETLRKKVLAEFSLEQMAESTLSLYTN
jgi:glycosyltransferase involved in cell wall biosynthesis